MASPQGPQTFQDPDVQHEADVNLINYWMKMEEDDDFLDGINLPPLEIAKSPDYIIIDDDGDEDEHELEVSSDIAQVIDLTEDDPPPRRKRQAARTKEIPLRNPPLDPDDCLEKYTCNNDFNIKQDDTVQISQPQGKDRIEFIKIQTIFTTPTGIITVRGLPFTRTRHLGGKLPRRRNEVCLILEVDLNDERPEHVQAAIQVPVSDVVKPRYLGFTSADFPEHRFDPSIYRDPQHAEDEGLLMCRWKHRRVWKESADRVSGKAGKAPAEYVFEHLRADEVPRRRRLEDSQRSFRWRGQTLRGGSFLPSAVVLDLEEQSSAQEDDDWIDREPGQRYTFGDMFSGAGGTSCGAIQAGFHLEVACDIDKHACKTYEVNFPGKTFDEVQGANAEPVEGTRLFRMDIHNLITKEHDNNLRVDILHLSPPCQFWSPAHTVEGKNDEANMAVLFTCHALVRKSRPRVFTLEQTFGILHPRFEYYWNSLIQGFANYGYSVRWKIIHLSHWGLPAKRMRLILIGSSPGEKLPPFPSPTHSEHPQPGDGGTLPFVTCAQALRRIPGRAVRADPLHDVRTAKRHRPPLTPRDPNKFLERTITCHGGIGNYHPSGRRNFTLREFATLQSFPVDYPFERTYAKKQIGNAFPPCVVKVLMSHIRRWLERMDRVRPVADEEVEVGVGGRDDYIEISDDEGDEGSSEGDVEIVDWRQRRPETVDSSSSSDSGVDGMDVDVCPALCVDAFQQCVDVDMVDACDG